MSKREFFIDSIIRSLIAIERQGRKLIRNNLIAEIMRQADVSERTAKEWLKIAEIQSKTKVFNSQKTL